MQMRLRLHNFRNYERLDALFPARTTCLIGENGQGKTSLLEAIYFLSILRSFRTHRIRDLRKAGESSFFVGADIRTENSPTPERLAVLWRENGRSLRINGRPVKKSSDFIRRIYAVSFVPEDIYLVKGSAGGRRRFMDITLSQLDPGYLSALQVYLRLVKTRNAILRDFERYGPAALQAFESPMANAAAEILEKRLQFLPALESAVRRIWSEMNGGDKDAVQLRYKPTLDPAVPSAAGGLNRRFLEAWRERLGKDKQRQTTTLGPHRDDFSIFYRNQSLSSYGSEGQCRLASICLKLAVVEILSAKIRAPERLILLIDDIVGELDPARRKGFLDRIFEAGKIFFAGTVLPPDARRGDLDVRTVRNGKIT